MDDTVIVEHFFGVYLLYCTNLKYRGRTYIGFTVNPKRRIKQHNGGIKHKGAWKTSNRGPWNMVLIIHGFPNNISALRFEWAWQHPHISRRLGHIPKKKSNQKVFDYILMVLSEMLKVGPWCRLPLTIRWLDYDFYKTYGTILNPPLHMPISCGRVTTKRLKKKKKELNVAVLESLTKQNLSINLCSLCKLSLEEEDTVRCIKSKCPLLAHLICLAKCFTEEDMLLPIEGTCPTCSANVLWGDLIRKKIGCYQDIGSIPDESSSSTNNDDGLD